MVNMVVIITQNRSNGKLQKHICQFIYKAEMSNTMCLTVLKEVVDYYESNKNTVVYYVCDAIQTFGIIRFGKLSVIMFEIQYPAIYIILMILRYIRVRTYQSHVRGNSVYKSCLGVNGI